MSQPAHLKENFVINLKLSTEIALGGSRFCHSPCRNLPSLDPVEDEFTRDPGLAESSHSGNTFIAPSYNPTPGPAPVLALILAPVLAPAPAPAATNNLFKQFIKAYLKSK